MKLSCDIFNGMAFYDCNLAQSWLPYFWTELAFNWVLLLKSVGLQLGVEC